MSGSGKERPVDALSSLRAGLAQGELLNAYLIYGDAGFLKTEAVKAVETAVLALGPASFNCDRFSGADADAGRVVAAAMTLPMMSPRRLVLIDNIDKMDDKGKKAIAEYLQSPSPSTTMLASATAISGRPTWLRAFSTAGLVVGLRGLYESEMPAFIRSEATRLGKRMSNDAVRYLSEMLGTNLAEVRAQLEKASLFVGDDPTLEVSALEAVVSDVSLESVFAFTDSVGAGKVSEALLQLDRLMIAEPYPARLLSLLHRHFRQLAAAHDLGDRGATVEETAAALGIYGGRLTFWRRNFLPQLKGWSSEQLDQAMALLQRTHVRLRTSLPPALVMEQTVLELCALRRA